MSEFNPVSTEVTDSAIESHISSQDTSVETQSQDQNLEAADTTQNVQGEQGQVTKDVTITKAEPQEESQEDGAQLNINDLVQQYIDGEELSEESLSALEALGLGEENFKMIAEGQKAIQEKNNNVLFEAVGGEQEYRAMQKFAGEHLGDGELEAFNVALRSGSMQLAKIATLGLNALYKQSLGEKGTQEPSKRVGGDAAVSQQTQEKYSSQQELINDLNDRRYAFDPDFINMVNQKRMRSQM